MTEKKPKLIDLKGANSTMKLGLVLYAAIVVALIVGACHAYAAGDPILDSKQTVRVHLQPYTCNRTHTSRAWYHAGRTFAEVA